MKRLMRIAVGYRSDLNLSNRWWHRLYQVTTACLFVALFVMLLPIWMETVADHIPITVVNKPSEDLKTPAIHLYPTSERVNHPLTAVIMSVITAGLFILIVANVYYRGVIYIAFGKPVVGGVNI